MPPPTKSMHKTTMAQVMQLLRSTLAVSTTNQSLPPGTPSPSHNTSAGPISFLGVTPSPSHNTSTGPISFLGLLDLHPIILQLVQCPFWGIPVTGPRSLPGRGYPSPRWRMGYPCPGMEYPQQGIGYPHPPQLGMGNPPPPPRDRTAEGVLATQREVCLLRSRRRTFFFVIVISGSVNILKTHYFTLGHQRNWNV